jgi:catechol 2,3-dioxygenase-like lactoylglutathione lyase family enzyme
LGRLVQIIQIGLNTCDMAGSLRLYSEAFGFSNAGAQCTWGETIRSQGLSADSRALMWWLVGCQKCFQLEFFHHTRPIQRPLRADWRPNDHGWVRLGIAVQDFERSESMLAQHNIPILRDPKSSNRFRRLAFRDPYIGAIVEVIDYGANFAKEYDADLSAGPGIVYATSSVSNIEGAKTFYRETLGFEIEPIESLHRLDDEVLWGLGNATREGFIARPENKGIRLEIVQYKNPSGRPRPPDYRTSDQGILNVALGSRDCTEVSDAFARLKSADLFPPRIVTESNIIFGYITDPEREFEFAAFPEELDPHVGFVASRPFFGTSIR